MGASLHHRESRRRAPPRRPAGAALGLFLFTASCTAGSCFSCLSPPAGPLPESERVYDGLQAVVTPEGFTAGAGAVVDNLTRSVPRFIFLTLPSTKVKAGAVDATACPNGCFMDISVGQVNVDRDVPNRLVFRATATLSGSIDLTGTPTCDVSVDARVPLQIDLTMKTDPLTRYLGGEVTAVTLDAMPADFMLTPSGCGSVDLTPLKNALAQLKTTFEAKVKAEAVDRFDQQLCLPCDTFSAGCPGGSVCSGGFPAVCRVGATNQCLYQAQGALGIANLSALTNGFYHDQTNLEFHLVAGQKDTTSADPLVDPGMAANFRFFGGVLPPGETPACVPPGLPPVRVAKRIDLQGEATKLAVTEQRLAGGFHVGTALTEPMLTRLLEGLYAGGGLCLELGPTLSTVLTADNLATLLPSIALVADKGSPAIINIRAKKPPKTTIGAGEFSVDSSGKRVLDKPLATIGLDSLEISVYANVGEHLTRLFSVESDARLALGTDITPNADGSAQILPLVGDLSGLANNVKVTHNEILAEDNKTIEAAVKALISLAQPALASQVTAFKLLSLSGLKLDLLAIHGISQRTSPDDFDAIGVFANIRNSPATAPVKTTAQILSIEDTPPGVTLLPRLTVLAGADRSDVEFQVRVDQGFWGVFQPKGTLVVDDPILAFPGRHTVDVRARRKGLWPTLDRGFVRLEATIARPAAGKRQARETVAYPLSPSPGEAGKGDPQRTPAQGCGTPGALLPLLPLALAALLRRRR